MSLENHEPLLLVVEDKPKLAQPLTD